MKQTKPPKVDKKGWIKPDPMDFFKVDCYKSFFYHIYTVGSFDPTANKRHVCLANGYWCWRNASEHPFDVFRYVTKRITQIFEKK